VCAVLFASKMLDVHTYLLDPIDWVSGQLISELQSICEMKQVDGNTSDIGNSMRSDI